MNEKRPRSVTGSPADDRSRSAGALAAGGRAATHESVEQICRTHAARIRRVAAAHHRRADAVRWVPGDPEGNRRRNALRARLRSYAVALEMQADALVPVELAGEGWVR